MQKGTSKQQNMDCQPTENYCFFEKCKYLGAAILQALKCQIAL